MFFRIYYSVSMKKIRLVEYFCKAVQAVVITEQ